ncbi:unnamed protein product [Polarella glacialis]|uniref:Uncharacterized protein n=1 Tax=Polarella glacialis TaxID=89957 RepID=A0A813K2W2_POLGL|nr:unnamed protein product [Polarella glacialis]
MWPPSCRPQFDKLARCYQQALEDERQSGRNFDWFVRLRPDLELADALPDIRALRTDGIHVPNFDWSYAYDSFALVPQAFAAVYFNTNEYNNGRCFSPDDYRRLGCRMGGCHCRLKHHLLNHSVPLYKLPQVTLSAATPSALQPWCEDGIDHLWICRQSEAFQRPGVQSGTGWQAFPWLGRNSSSSEL